MRYGISTDGSPPCIYEITLNGILVKHLLGRDVDEGQKLVITIKTGSWFGSRVEVPSGFTLCGCTVAPGFDFADFELADNQMLQKEYPQHTELINQMTR